MNSCGTDLRSKSRVARAINSAAPGMIVSSMCIKKTHLQVVYGVGMAQNAASGGRMTE